MAVIRINTFKGIAPAVAPRLLRNEYAQIAHNTLLRDGKLRPYAKWQLTANALPETNSIVFNKKTKAIQSTYLFEAVKLTGAPFPPDGFVGIDPDSSELVSVNLYLGASYTTGIPTPDTQNFSYTYSQQLLSKKPVSRGYGYTIARYNGVGYEESTLAVVSGANE